MEMLLNVNEHTNTVDVLSDNSTLPIPGKVGGRVATVTNNG